MKSEFLKAEKCFHSVKDFAVILREKRRFTHKTLKKYSKNSQILQ